VASVKPSPHAAGKDARGAIALTPVRMSARNVSLKAMIGAAYGVQPYQVGGGPGWLDLDEFDLDARTAQASTAGQLNAMLQALLAERFHLTVHRETKEMRVYALAVGKGGARLHAAAGELKPSTSPENFHGNMRQFCNLISVQLSIPAGGGDPTRPSIASGPPVPVLDQTGLEGNFDISVHLGHDAGDAFTSWQSALQDQLGLRLESQKAAVELVVVEHTDRLPTGN
jgi:uncharacterized protein (TIGR03435 family)